MAVIHEDDVAWQDEEHGGHAFRRRSLGRAAGARDLGCSLYELEPGRADFPFHLHHGNEEAVYVLSGTGVVETDDGEVPLRPGSYAAFPAGTGHRVRNDGGDPLRFLCVSTMRHPDVTEYPHQNAVGVFCGSAPGGDPARRTYAAFLSRDAVVPYWP